jgi:hypothetical protein
VTRLQVQKQLRRVGESSPEDEYHSIADAAVKIYKKEGGLSAFFSGCGQDVAKTIVDSFLFFLAYNFVRDSRLKARGTKRLPMGEELGVGMLAGAFSRLFTTPVQNIVTRKQTAAMIAAKADIPIKAPNLTMAEIAAQIKREKGVIGFWSGYSATLVLTLNPALTFLFHETLLRMLVKRDRRQNPGSRTTFIIAALSKAIASSITYPFSLAKSRLQVSAKSPASAEIEKISEKDSLEDKGKKSATTAERLTVFHILIKIVQEEGLLALYSGLEGDVLKGFFSHGLTMLLKARIHKVVINLYYMVLKALKRYPGPEATAKLAVQSVSAAAVSATNSVTDSARSISAMSQKKVEEVVETIHDLYQNEKERHMDIVDEYVPADDDDLF